MFSRFLDDPENTCTSEQNFDQMLTYPRQPYKLRIIRDLNEYERRELQEGVMCGDTEARSM